MANESGVLQITAKDLSQLSDATAARTLELADKINLREHSYATSGMRSGLISFATCVASFTFLVHDGHPKSAFTVLGAGVLSIIGKMIGARLSRTTEIQIRPPYK
jgi:hypothetical protein